MKNSSTVDSFLQNEVDPAFRRRAKFILSNLRIKTGDKILEIGCGRGFYANVIASFFPQASYVGIDINENYLKIAKNFARGRNVQFQKADATRLPFVKNTFDAIIC